MGGGKGRGVSCAGGRGSVAPIGEYRTGGGGGGPEEGRNERARIDMPHRGGGESVPPRESQKKDAHSSLKETAPRRRLDTTATTTTTTTNSNSTRTRTRKRKKLTEEYAQYGVEEYLDREVQKILHVGNEHVHHQHGARHGHPPGLYGRKDVKEHLDGIDGIDRHQQDHEERAHLGAGDVELGHPSVRCRHDG